MRGRGEQGSGTVVGAFVILTLVAFTALLSWVGATVSARHRAQSAADLAALAGAYAALDGSEAACAAARDIVGRAAGRLVDCTLVDLDVVVTVEVQAATGGLGPARALARAGPSPSASAR